MWLRFRLLQRPSLPLLRVIASALHRMRMHMPCTYLPTSACYHTNRCTNTTVTRAVAVRGAVGEGVGAALALLRCSSTLLLYYLPSLVCVAAAVSNVRLFVLLLLRVYVRCSYTTAVGGAGDGAVTITHERVVMCCPHTYTITVDGIRTVRRIRDCADCVRAPLHALITLVLQVLTLALLRLVLVLYTFARCVALCYVHCAMRCCASDDDEPHCTLC